MNLDRPHLSVSPWLVQVTALAFLSASCGGGGSSVSSGQDDDRPFELVSISIDDGDVLELNRPIELVFSRAIAFSSVGPNTIAIRSSTGVPAVGTYSLPAPDRVVFVPACPTRPDYADAGLGSGGMAYTLDVHGSSGGAGATVRSAEDERLVDGVRRGFSTVRGSDLASLFHDPVAGPPSPVVRPVDSSLAVGSYVEVGGDANDRRYFEFEVETQSYVSPVGLPLNLNSDSTTEVAIWVALDQPLDPAPDNLARFTLEAEVSGVWYSIGSDVELLSNCGQAGAFVRVQPTGILPRAARIRVVLAAGLRDLVGEPTLLPIDHFGIFETALRLPGDFVDPELFADEVREDFDTVGAATGQDVNFSFPGPRANWGGGALAATTSFGGTGGPGGDFDWTIESGEVFVFDTTSTLVVGGPEYGNQVAATFTDGQVDVRTLWLKPGSVLRVQGPKPLQIRATGDVVIEGLINLCGFDAVDVDSFSDPGVLEIGAAGSAGGGRGGTGSSLHASSTPMGGTGFGPFGESLLGGVGGETGYGAGDADEYIPGGGGGGVFAAAQAGFEIGLVPSDGQSGGTFATGAMSQASPPAGGSMGPSPFVDGDPSNDFCGVAVDAETGEWIVGELTQPRAGGGGGAGGDSVRDLVFPNPYFPFGDWKGAGGGGGAGCLDIWSIGDIRIGRNGRIRADGGDGAYGQRINGGLPIGGGSGAGAGGHVILQASGHLRFDTLGANAITAVGGRGGPGSTQFGSFGAGGDGGPGLIQFHVEDPDQKLILPNGAGLGTRSAPDPLVLIPIQALESRARSTWIPLDGAAASADASGRPIDFLFAGIDPTEGFVLDVDGDGFVDDPAPLLTPAKLVGPPGVPYLAFDQVTFVLDAAALSGVLDDVYLRNPLLLVGFQVALESSDGSYVARHSVVHADYDASNERLEVLVADPVALPATAVEIRLVPRYFGVATDGVEGALPAGASIQVLFQATGIDADGGADGENPLTAWTADAATLDVEGAAFLRFEVRFALPGADSPRPTLDFLRVPFRF